MTVARWSASPTTRSPRPSGWDATGLAWRVPRVTNRQREPRRRWFTMRRSCRARAMSAPGIVDLRRDTVTGPDEGMRAAMAHAEVGDDVWREDPTVRRLEEEMARRLGKQAAVFVPSGTMGNLACVAALTRPGDEVIVDAMSHVVLNEA